MNLMYLPICLFIYFLYFSLCPEKQKYMKRQSNRNTFCPCVYLQEKYTLSLCVSTTKIYVVPVCIYNRNIGWPFVFLQQKYTSSLCVSTKEIYVVPLCFYNKNVRCPCVYLQQYMFCPSLYLRQKYKLPPVCICNRNIVFSLYKYHPMTTSRLVGYKL